MNNINNIVRNNLIPLQPPAGIQLLANPPPQLQLIVNIILNLPQHMDNRYGLPVQNIAPDFCHLVQF